MALDLHRHPGGQASPRRARVAAGRARRQHGPVSTRAGHPRRRPPVPDRRRVPAVAELEQVGLAAGLDAVGVAPATAFATTRRHLERRKAAGLHAGMSFTYRRPERSTDPGQALPGARTLVVGAWAYRRVGAP